VTNVFSDTNIHTLPAGPSGQSPLPPPQGFRSPVGTTITGIKRQNAIPMQNLPTTGSSSTTQPILQRSSRSTGNQISMPSGEYILLGVNRGYQLQLAQIDRNSCLDDGEFFAKLRWSTIPDEGFSAGGLE